jgi:hypothetical protein
VDFQVLGSAPSKIPRATSGSSASHGFGSHPSRAQRQMEEDVSVKEKRGTARPRKSIRFSLANARRLSLFPLNNGIELEVWLGIVMSSSSASHLPLSGLALPHLTDLPLTTRTRTRTRTGTGMGTMTMTTGTGTTTTMRTGTTRTRTTGTRWDDRGFIFTSFESRFCILVQ